MKIDRLVSIIMILLDKQRIGAQELADKFEVSPRTIYRGKGNRLYHLLTDPFECRNLCDENADQIHYLRLLLSDQQGPPNKIFQEYKKSFDA